jgi:hypothetical protein
MCQHQGWHICYLASKSIKGTIVLTPNSRVGLNVGYTPGFCLSRARCVLCDNIGCSTPAITVSYCHYTQISSSSFTTTITP